MRRRLSTPWGPGEEALLLAMDGAGSTIVEIAAVLGRPYSSVYGKLRVLQKPAAVMVPAVAPAAAVAAAVAQVEAPAPAPAPAAAPAPAPGSVRTDGMVRCLGGCGQMWHSPDRLRIRRCPRCRGRTGKGASGMSEHALRL